MQSLEFRVWGGSGCSLCAPLLFFQADDALSMVRDEAEQVLHVAVPDIHHLIHALINSIDAAIDAAQASLVQQNTNQRQNRRRSDHDP